MLAKTITILLLIFILGSLFTALYQLMRKRGSGEGRDASVVKALTVRVALSVGLFILLLLSFRLGLISPQGMR